MFQGTSVPPVSAGQQLPVIDRHMDSKKKEDNKWTDGQTMVM